MSCCLLASAADAGDTKAKPAATRAAAAPKPVAKQPQGFTVAPVPAWVSELPVDASIVVPKAAVHFEVVDNQTLLDAKGGSSFLRRVWVVNESAGLQSSGQVQVAFDPSYQKLVLHKLQVVRGTQRVDKLDVRQVKLLNRETQLERQMYDGQVTASLVIDDLRVGDHVEWAYSLVGSNPVFAGRFVDIDMAATSFGPIALIQYRLLAPEARQIRHAAAADRFEVSSSVKAGMRETLIRRRAVPQLHGDSLTDASALVPDLVQWSEFADWSEVASWAQGLFARSGGIAPEVQAQADVIRAAAATPAERLQRALDFVQTEIRYFGTEMGASSHRPAAPELVLKQRFGDCKDKVALLTALLKALDVEAVPALVSTRLRASTGAMLPSPLVFDHVIARVSVGDAVHWLDGTLSQQRGPVGERSASALGQVLLARSQETEPVAVPDGSGELRATEADVITVEDFALDPVLERLVTYHGPTAEMVRASRAMLAPQEFDKLIAADFGRSYPSARADGPLVFAEVEDHNAVTLRQRYLLPKYWRFPERRVLTGDVSLGLLAQTLRLADQAPRVQAIRLSPVGIYRHTVRIAFPEPVNRQANSNSFDERNDNFELHVDTRADSDRFELKGELNQRRDVLPAGAWEAYRSQLIKVFPRLQMSAVVSALSMAQVDEVQTTLKTMEQMIRSGDLRVVTPGQLQMRAQLVLLDAQIAFRRMSPDFIGELLIERGGVLDHLGRTADALADFQRAATLRPADAAVQTALSMNALMRRDDAAVARHSAAALQLSTNDQTPRRTLAYSKYFEGEYGEARHQLTQALKSQREVDNGYAALWLYLSTRRAGADGKAAVEPYLPLGDKPAWPNRVLQFYRGNATFDDVLAATKDERGRMDPGKACEAYFFAAQKSIVDGDLDGARKLLRRSIDTSVIEYVEHNLAQRELDRIGRR